MPEPLVLRCQKCKQEQTYVYGVIGYCCKCSARVNTTPKHRFNKSPYASAPKSQQATLFDELPDSPPQPQE